MAYARALITAEEVRAILDKDSLDDAETKLIGNHLIPAVSKAIEHYCDRNILDTNIALTEYHRGDGTEILQLKQWPINSITSVKSRQNNPSSYDSTAYDYTLTENTDFVQLESGLTGQLLMIDGAWQDVKPYFYQVVYRAGYTTANMPEDIKMAAKTWVAILYQKVTNKLHGVKTHLIGDEAITYDTDAIPNEVKMLLSPYVRREFNYGW